MSKYQLVLEDGSVFKGTLFGSAETMNGDVVFYNGMTGYQEIISDPANAGKIIVMTQPLVGNYGINRDDFETLDPCVNGFIVKEVSDYPSNFRSEESLDQFFKAHHIPGITGIDTRKLVTHIRKHGVMKGRIAKAHEKVADIVENLRSTREQADLVKHVSTVKPYIIPGRGTRIVLVDLGMKHGILRELTKRDCHITVVPYDYSYEKLMRLKPEGVMFSNGPGHPEHLPELIDLMKQLLGQKPFFAIGLGHLLFALSIGATIDKLPYGQHGNYPVKTVAKDQANMVSKTQLYTVNPSSMKAFDVTVSHIGVNSPTIEGLTHQTYPAFSVQFNPESSPGPEEMTHLFDLFLDKVNQFPRHKEETSHAEK
ncbi:MAG TPA: carbamoyl phosphate synthase small subunit [Cerasibacillus sp.]|uniref:carbamoyl phosphate synthase small subunit n=1 Tax=Cerasibacillus sp. TaxID=2498711 RepID=UPI002F3EA08B